MESNEKDFQLAQLRSTLGKMEIALGSINEAIVWISKSGNIQWCNSTFDRLVEQPHINLIGKPIQTVLPLLKHNEPVDLFKNPFQQCLIEKSKINEIFEYLSSPKKLVLEILCSYVEFPNQEELVISIIRDVTTQTELEKYKLLNAAVLNAANAIAITDQNGHIIWINPAFTQLTGYMLDDVYLKTFQILKSGKNDSTIYKDLWKTILRGQVWEGRLINKRKDGSQYIEEQTIAPVRNDTGEVTHFIAIKQDVTEAEQIKTELEKLSIVASNTNNAVIITDQEGYTEWVNEGFTRITGYQLQEVIGKKPGELLQGPNTNPETVKRMRQKIKASEGFSEQIINYHKDGHSYWLQIDVTPVYDEEGRLSRFVAVESDISKQKQAEESLRHYQNHLEEMVKERTRELKEAQEDLVNRAVESGRSQLAAMIMHNIGNAVTPFQSLIEQSSNIFPSKLFEYLLNCFKELDDQRNNLTQFVNYDQRGQQLFEYLGELIHSLQTSYQQHTNNLEKMGSTLTYISEILTMQQLYSPSSESSPEIINPNDLIENALKMQLTTLEKRGIQLKQYLAHNLPEIKIDKNRLMQVVINLLKNAYEAIDMCKNPTLKEISIKTELKTDQILVSITDTGIGIDKAQMKEIFEYGKSHKGSSGFGLHYCKMFVKNSGGTLKVYSQGKNTGATIKIGLPI